MHNIRQISALLAAISLCVACSSTPGDAASRAGQFDTAAKLYRQGAEQGDGQAALKLGLLLLKADLPHYGTPGSWFIRGCDLGELVACHNAGVGFEYAQQGLPKDYSKAHQYYLIAALKGYLPAEYNLGSLYANSYVSDDLEGLTWLLVSQRHAKNCLPNPGCKWILDDEPGHAARLKTRMSADQIVEAERKARRILQDE